MSEQDWQGILLLLLIAMALVSWNILEDIGNRKRGRLPPQGPPNEKPDWQKPPESNGGWMV